MSPEAKENKVVCRAVREADVTPLLEYLAGLSAETRSYFAPHPFDAAAVAAICESMGEGLRGFVCEAEGELVGYAVVRRGYSEGEWYRFPDYAIEMNPGYDFLFAPSVADSFQSKGIGSKLLVYVEHILKEEGAHKLVLWGGVQSRNQKAVRYYQKNGFQTLGEFHHEGLDNLDMVKYLSDQ